MDKTTLLLGAIAMVIVGAIVGEVSFVAIGTGLFYLYWSVRTKENEDNG